MSLSDLVTDLAQNEATYTNYYVMFIKCMILMTSVNIIMARQWRQGDRELVHDGRTNERKEKKHAVLGTSCLYIITINYRFKVWKHTHTEYTYSTQ